MDFHAFDSLFSHNLFYHLTQFPSRLAAMPQELFPLRGVFTSSSQRLSGNLRQPAEPACRRHYYRSVRLAGANWACTKRIKKAGVFNNSGFCETAFHLDIYCKPIKSLLPHQNQDTIRRKEQTHLITLIIITPRMSFASIFLKFF